MGCSVLHYLRHQTVVITLVQDMQQAGGNQKNLIECLWQMHTMKDLATTLPKQLL